MDAVWNNYPYRQEEALYLHCLNYFFPAYLFLSVVSMSVNC